MKAMWIAPEQGAAKENLYFRAVRCFELHEIRVEAKLRIAADSFYRLWINGREAGCGPARGSRTLNFYDELEVGHLLRPGRNVVAVLVHNINLPNNLSSPVCGALLAELDGLFFTGDGGWKLRLAEEGEWRHPVPWFGPNLCFMEWRDFAREPAEWLNGAQTEQWNEPVVQGTADEAFPGKQLLPRPVPLLRETFLPPVEIAALTETPAPMGGLFSSDVAVMMAQEADLPYRGELSGRAILQALAEEREFVFAPPGDGRGVSLIFDFAAECIGRFEAVVTAPVDGVIVDIAYDEELDNGRLNSGRGTCFTCRMADRFLLKAGENRVGTSLLDRGFRLVRMVIRSFDAPVSVRSVRAVDRRYPASRSGEFRCSSPVLTRLWDICTETLSACATDVFLDCPWRERSFWVNDLLVENLTWLQAMGDPELCAHSLRLALSNIREDGWMPGVCPDSGDSRLVLLPTNLFMPLILKDYLLYSGDLELARELLPAVRGLLRQFDRYTDAEGLFVPPEQYWNFFDWSYELCGVKLDRRQTSLLEFLRCLAWRAAAELCDFCGEKGEGDSLRARIPALAAAVLKRFWPENAARCSDWLEPGGTPSRESSQLTHALALLAGILPDGKRALATEALEDNSIRMPEIYLHHFLFLAMEEAGLEDEELSRVRTYWGNLVAVGATTLWETNICEPRGKRATGNTGSLCHAFGASPVGVFQRTLLGVRPLAPGFREFTFRPRPCDVESAAGSIPTPAGIIGVSWRKEGMSLLATLEIPEGLIALLDDGRRLEGGRHELRLPVEPFEAARNFSGSPCISASSQ